jgi:hypothetical protein
VRVLVAPDIDLGAGTRGAAVAAALAGEDGLVISLAQVGLPAWEGRPLSAADTQLIREAMGAGRRADREGDDMGVGDGERPVVGYVCTGRPTSVSLPAQSDVVAVVDHAGLTWRSPLAGPNDEAVGPRFPRVDGVYVPEVVMERVGGLPGVTITSAVVAGVRHQDALSDWERHVVDSLGFPVSSATLVAVALIAAHMGMRMAAAVLL